MVQLQIALALTFTLVIGGHASQERISDPNDLSYTWSPGVQRPCQASVTEPDQQRNPLTPLGDFCSLSETEFSHMKHPLFPHYNVRIKKSSFCDGTVGSYTGYIDIGTRHLFFYFFESRNDPTKDDVIFWTTGGPGCSSSLGLFMELGPCKVSGANGTKYHPESWNSNANIIFIDQPVGVGFSYADHGEFVGTSEEAAKDAAAFVAIFFAHFKRFSGLPFHMAGDSYSGRYIPLFASEVYDQNSKLVKAGMPPINLTSIIIGNGYVDFATLIPSYFDMQCTPASISPVLDIASCVRMKRVVPRCERWIKESCVDQFDSINCGAAMGFCETELSKPFFTTGKNPYDISKECTQEELQDTLCYSITKVISEYLSRPDIHTLLGVDPSIPANFTACSTNVSSAFSAAQDGYRSSHYHVAALLDRGVKALVYAGTYDWICNWVANQRWTLALEWNGQEEFRRQALEDWKVDGKRVGKFRSAKGLTFATIEGAGHLVPQDKPKEALELVNRWLSGNNL